MKKWGKRLAALIVCGFLLATTVFAATIPEPPRNSCVLDKSNVLSDATEEYVNERTVELEKACGAQIAVVTVDFTGSLSTADYATEVLNKWGVGDKNKDNGIVLLLAIGEEDYFCALGTGLEKELSASSLDDLLYSELEPGFAKEDYDQGVRDFVDAISEKIAQIYDADLNYTTSHHSASTADKIGQRIKTIFQWVVIAIGVVCLIIEIKNGYFGGILFRNGSSYHTGRRSSSYSHRSFTPSHRSSSRSSFSGFRGGSSRGSGVGRSSSGGSRSGGAGRRR